MPPISFDINNVQIRPGQRADIPAAHRLVGELAAFEKAYHAFTATMDDYYHDFEQGHFNLLIAEYHGVVIGMALYYQTYSTWKGLMYHLEDFVVQEAYRNKGVGQKIFDAFIAESKKRGARMVKWEVLDWNTNALRFYERNQAEVEKDWWNCKIIF